MKTQTFNLSKAPLLLFDKVAYLVDYKNVELYRQYVEKYYSKLELDWYDELIMSEIENNEFILYFGAMGFTYDDNNELTTAYTEHYTIYYVTNALMIVE
jgi:hypothetical protein